MHRLCILRISVPLSNGCKHHHVSTNQKINFILAISENSTTAKPHISACFPYHQRCREYSITAVHLCGIMLAEMRLGPFAIFLLGTIQTSVTLDSFHTSPNKSERRHAVKSTVKVNFSPLL